ncbi:MAG: HEAT repeat domain-containing protein [Spirochaetia bacterium]|nr:HEAT repeat domain-containing protein [Spirochaetia bacterium]
MKKFKTAIISAIFNFLVINGYLAASDFKTPKLTEHAQDLIETLKIGPLEERIRAIEECGINGYIPCYYTLVSLLNDPAPVIRKKSAISLGLLRNKNAIPHLEKAMESEKDESVQIDIIRSLWFFKNKESAVFAEKYLSSNSEKLRFIAAKVLTTVTDDSLYDKIGERLKVENSDIVKVMLLHASLKIKKTSANVTELIKYFYSTQTNVRLYAARAAGDLKIKEALLDLKKALILEPDVETRFEFHKAYNETFIN